MSSIGQTAASATTGGLVNVVAPGGRNRAWATFVREQRGSIAWAFPITEQTAPSGGTSVFPSGDVIFGTFWKLHTEGKFGWALDCLGVTPVATAVATDGSPFVAGAFVTGAACGDASEQALPATQTPTYSDAFIARLRELP
jgi:hypothetical protein